MASIVLKNPEGIIPRTSPKLLPDRAAQIAENLSLLSGRFEPIHAPGNVTSLPDANRKTIFKYRGTTTEWLSWVTDVDIVDGPINDDQYKRIYYTGDGSGKLKVRGTFGEREVGMVSPAKITTSISPYKDVITPSELYVYSGLANGDRVCPLVSSTDNGDGTFTLRYYFPGQYTTAGSWSMCTNPSLSKTLTFPGADPEDLPEGATKNSCGNNPLNLVTTVKDGTGEVFQTITVTDIDESALTSIWTPPDPAWTAKTDRGNIDITVLVEYTSEKTYFYVQRYVDDTGAEGPPSTVSDEVNVNNQSSTLTLTLGNDSGVATYITKKRIYRAAGTADDSGFMYLGEVNKGVTTFVDDKTDGELVELMPAYGNPQDDLEGLVSMPGGFLAAFIGKDIYFSEPGLPHVWPWKYNQTVDHKIVGLAVRRNTLVVTTEGSLYAFSGSHPSYMNPIHVAFAQPCSSKRGISSMGDMVFYPSPDGLVIVSDAGGRLVTEKFFKKEDWQDLNPSTMIAAVYDNKLFACFQSQTVIFDFDEGLSAVVKTSELAQGMYSDLLDDELYLIQSSNITKWNDSNEDFLQMTWKSKIFTFDFPVAWSCARVIADNYPAEDDPDLRVRLKLYAHGSLVHTSYFSSEREKNLPLLRPDREWELELIAYTGIDKIAVATNHSEV